MSKLSVFLLTFIVGIIICFFSFDVDNIISPRTVGWSITEDYCGTEVTIAWDGCDPCFTIAYDRPLETPKWIEDVAGCSIGYRVSQYTYTFRIDVQFDAREAIEQIQLKLQERLCK